MKAGTTAKTHQTPPHHKFKHQAIAQGLRPRGQDMTGDERMAKRNITNVDKNYSSPAAAQCHVGDCRSTTTSSPRDFTRQTR